MSPRNPKRVLFTIIYLFTYFCEDRYVLYLSILPLIPNIIPSEDAPRIVKIKNVHYSICPKWKATKDNEATLINPEELIMSRYV